MVKISTEFTPNKKYNDEEIHSNKYFFKDLFKKNIVLKIKLLIQCERK